jgi:hypothetical protein
MVDRILLIVTLALIETAVLLLGLQLLDQRTTVLVIGITVITCSLLHSVFGLRNTNEGG